MLRGWTEAASGRWRASSAEENPLCVDVLGSPAVVCCGCFRTFPTETPGHQLLRLSVRRRSEGDYRALSRLGPASRPGHHAVQVLRPSDGRGLCGTLCCERNNG